jgi:hypothetical protein
MLVLLVVVSVNPPVNPTLTARENKIGRHCYDNLVVRDEPN